MPAPLNKIKYVKTLVPYVILLTPLTNLNCEFPEIPFRLLRRLMDVLSG